VNIALAPEHPFPAAIDEAVAVWRWLRTDQDLSPRSIAVAGDSAGGGLDLTSSGASMTERGDHDPISTPAMLGQFASDYLAGADPKNPLASRLLASLSELPPLLVQVVTADLFSDSERLTRAAAEASVDVTLQVGLAHVYQLLLDTPEAAEQVGKFLRARVGCQA
jgi:epsilon-lactone hydrolase